VDATDHGRSLERISPEIGITVGSPRLLVERAASELAAVSR
jgi:hypothetical protein